MEFTVQTVVTRDCQDQAGEANWTDGFCTFTSCSTDLPWHANCIHCPKHSPSTPHTTNAHCLVYAAIFNGDSPIMSRAYSHVEVIVFRSRGRSRLRIYCKRSIKNYWTACLEIEVTKSRALIRHSIAGSTEHGRKISQGPQAFSVWSEGGEKARKGKGEATRFQRKGEGST